MTNRSSRWIDDVSFHEDVQYIEALWQQRSIGTISLPLIDIGVGEPVVFVPFLEHLEAIYARQMRTMSHTRRVILYRRLEMRTKPWGKNDRAEELRQVLDGLGLECADLIGHGDAAMILFEFALRYPQRCRSLTIIAQGADSRTALYPLVWLLRELLYRLPFEYVLPAAVMRVNAINDILTRNIDNHTTPSLPRHLLEEQYEKILQWPFLYKYSILPIIHNFNIRKRLGELTMPILLINRTDDALTPESKTRWLAQHLPNCAGYHVVSGRERYFMYSRAGTVTPLIEAFLSSRGNHLLTRSPFQG
ncbi:alpha/beta fold hydrolase [Dictyobacter arantiisoli]|uniref:AB hydrolase-1 domain-containing protein n=1 Tax=Dictyobacter arantiisoli TaxID=2014874 RepID=A0A5A5TH11_9CHLR|nr:alpha/beta hydrolase [Dictyobacter arantiisoli]GCF10525.1 hypothetical protein KDI_40890 [Dictyobacter arantiisoli]